MESNSIRLFFGVSLSPVSSGGWVGGCRHRCKVDGERVSEQRWDFFPSLFFFSSLSIYSSRAAECHLLSHNWSRNERCLFVAASVCLCVCVSEYITSGCINSGIFLT